MLSLATNIGCLKSVTLMTDDRSSVQLWWNDNGKGKQKYSKKNLSQCNLIHKTATWVGLSFNPGFECIIANRNHYEGVLSRTRKETSYSKQTRDLFNILTHEAQYTS